MVSGTIVVRAAERVELGLEVAGAAMAHDESPFHRQQKPRAHSTSCAPAPLLTSRIAEQGDARLRERGADVCSTCNCVVCV